MSFDLRDSLFSKILTPQEYGSIPFAPPYILDFSTQSHGLLLYGTEHSADPDDPKFVDIELKFKNFISKFRTDKIVIAIESNIPQNILSKEEMVREYRESGFLTFLANQFSISTICPEPKEKILPLLVEVFDFNKRDILLWAFLNTYFHVFLKSGLDKTKLVAFFRDLDRVLDLNVLDTAQETTILSVIQEHYWQFFCDRLSQIGSDLKLPSHIEVFLEDYKKINVSSLEKAQTPFVTSTVINDIASGFNNVRDRYMTREILEVLAEGKSVFGVLGTNHVVAQEPAYRYFFDMKS
jgi:hypothetical protein